MGGRDAAQVVGSPYAAPQPRLFDLEALWEAGWLKALRLEGYRTAAELTEHLVPLLRRVVVRGIPKRR